MVRVFNRRGRAPTTRRTEINCRGGRPSTSPDRKTRTCTDRNPVRRGDRSACTGSREKKNCDRTLAAARVRPPNDDGVCPFPNTHGRDATRFRVARRPPAARPGRRPTRSRGRHHDFSNGVRATRSARPLRPAAILNQSRVPYTGQR